MAVAAAKGSARAFARDWAGRGYEKGETAQFWDDLLRRVLGVADSHDLVCYEVRADNGGFIDVLFPDAGVLVEQKAAGVDLDKPEGRQGRMVTPFEQALAYVEGFPNAAQPRYIVTCNFGTFRVYDRDACGRSELPSTYLEFTLAELGENPSYLTFVTDKGNSRQEKERRASIKAGALIGNLYDALLVYYDRDSAEDLHALNVLCVRLVFCLYCEDAGLFPKDALYDYLYDVRPADTGQALRRLFRALDTPPQMRDRFDVTTKPFPYVNGGLFTEDVPVPPFDEATKRLLLEETSRQTDWSHISPTIFGGIFESTLNPETRHAGGMHYTSPENIHKVIDPLFLDGLKAELRGITDSNETPRRKLARLRAWHERLCGLAFLDPACGSGNFLTETYRCLRRLEDDCLNAQAALDKKSVEGQMSFALDGSSGPHVSLNQFCGIEVNDFACRVAKTALWIAKLQADGEGMAQDLAEPFPLHESANVVCANALRIDWGDVLPAQACDYVMGNPPFLGARNQSKEQKTEVMDAFHDARNCGNVDYVAAWYVKAAEYMDGHPARCAFVSTNSICQGEQVANVWKPIYDLGYRIDFAHDTFRWANEASDQAHVFVVIVGFSKLGGPKTLYHHAGPDAEAVVARPAALNAYLTEAPDVFVWNRSKSLCKVPQISIGSQPIDGGSFLFTDAEHDAFVKAEPLAARYFHRWLGSQEFINCKPRWVLWLGNVTPQDMKEMPEARKRIDAVRQFRLASSRVQTQKAANRPNHFGTEIIPTGDSILIPKVSSERRRYIPMGFVGPETLCSDLVFLVPDATLWHFGVLQSQFHNAWMRTVCGRLKSDYRYSGGIVYNTFVWPEPTEAQRAEVEACARAVLDARGKYPDSTLADMYDPDDEWMFPDLAAAHRALDAAVERAYGVDFDGDEQAIVAHLFALYAQATTGE